MGEETKAIVVHRLTQEVYEKFEKSLPKPAADASTSPVQAGWLLGVQFVLTRLRQDLVL